MALPKTVKYLLCYLPFILVGTGLVVFGVFMKDSARIASLIVGVVVLFSGLFAWCTDSDVGCLVVCSCWANRSDRRIPKLKKGSKSTTPASPAEIFTIHSARGGIATSAGAAQSPQTTTASKKTSRVRTIAEGEEEGAEVEEEGKFKEGKMIQRSRHNQYGQFSLHSMHQQRSFDEEGSAPRKLRMPTRAASVDNHLNNYKPNGIHGRQELRLTVRNLQKLDRLRQSEQSLDSGGDGGGGRHHEMHYTSQDTLEIDIITLSIHKKNSIKSWIADVHNSREDIATMHETRPNSSASWGVSNKGYDSGKIVRKPLPDLPMDHASASSGSAIDIEVHSLPPSYGSDGNKSPSLNDGSNGSPSPDYNRRINHTTNVGPGYDLNGYIVAQNLQHHQSVLEAAIADRYV